MVLASIVLIFGTIAGVGFAGEGHFNLPLAWVLDKDGNSVDIDGNDVIDNADAVEGLSASDLMAGGDISSSESVMAFATSGLKNGGEPNYCLKVDTSGVGTPINDDKICGLGKICKMGLCLKLGSYNIINEPKYAGKVISNDDLSATMYCISQGYDGAFEYVDQFTDDSILQHYYNGANWQAHWSSNNYISEIICANNQ